MRVALHVGQLFQPVPGGIGRYTASLAAHLPAAGVDVLPFAAARPSAAVAVSSDPRYVDLGRPRGRWRYEAWHRLGHPVLRLGADLVHAPSLAVPPAGRIPLVVTVHDLAFRSHPATFTRRGLRFHERGLELARRRAGAVVVPSAYVAGELAKAGFDAARTFVAPHGLAPVPEPPAHEVASRVRRLGVVGPFVLFAGTLEPRKGVDVLLDAFRVLRRRHPDLLLVLAGPTGWGEVGGLDGAGVLAPGRLGDDDLDALYRSALALAYPSWGEGFGLPVLEAMGRGCPVVTTSVTSLPEVAGDAGVLVEPGDAEALAGALDLLVADPAERERRSRLGRGRARRFTWEASVDVHLAAYRSARGPAGAGS